MSQGFAFNSHSSAPRNTIERGGLSPPARRPDSDPAFHASGNFHFLTGVPFDSEFYDGNNAGRPRPPYFNSS
eukprot:1884050-Pleurochrysis_carterae.AAC.1